MQLELGMVKVCPPGVHDATLIDWVYPTHPMLKAIGKQPAGNAATATLNVQQLLATSARACPVVPVRPQTNNAIARAILRLNAFFIIGHR